MSNVFVKKVRIISTIQQLYTLSVCTRIETMYCQFCDGPGNPKTYKHQMPMPINGKVCYVDHCIAKLVAALNAANIETRVSCCGHGEMPGRIDLTDGRVITITEGSIFSDKPLWVDVTLKDFDKGMADHSSCMTGS